MLTLVALLYSSKPETIRPKDIYKHGCSDIYVTESKIYINIESNTPLHFGRSQGRTYNHRTATMKRNAFTLTQRRVTGPPNE
jgi:hypothetical protein